MMSDNSHNRDRHEVLAMNQTLGKRISVEELRLGLYVCALDRPWLETPFLFQGFALREESELQQLRELCRYVYVDEARSEVPPLPAAAPTPAAPAGQDDLERAFGRAPFPENTGFRRLVREAVLVRSRAREVVAEVLEDVRLGRSLRAADARALVGELAESITRNASAALWLTSLKRQDEYTSIHCINVCVLALAFGRFLGLPREELEVLGLGALLHDIGKMHTPDAILNKPDRLTPEEFDVIRRHPQQGYEALLGTQGIPPAALDIVRLHHERLSGRGYPLGLQGEAIPLAVRITALADVYDAMTSDRVYQAAVPADRALKVLYAIAGDDFGEELVQQFIRCIGIYPVGSLVELESGALGVVIGADPHWRLKPVVVLVRDAQGREVQERRLVNLGALAEAEDPPGWAVRGLVNPAARGVDVAAVAAREAGL